MFTWRELSNRRIRKQFWQLLLVGPAVRTYQMMERRRRRFWDDDGSSTISFTDKWHEPVVDREMRVCDGEDLAAGQAQPPTGQGHKPACCISGMHGCWSTPYIYRWTISYDPLVMCRQIDPRNYPSGRGNLKPLAYRKTIRVWTLLPAVPADMSIPGLLHACTLARDRHSS